MKHLPNLIAMWFWWLIIASIGWAFNVSFKPGIGLGVMSLFWVAVTVFYIGEIAKSK